MAFTNVAEVTEVIPELIEAKVLDAVNTREFWNKIVGAENLLDLGTVGKVTNIPQLPTVSLAATTENTAPSDTVFNPTDRQVTMATYGSLYTVSWEALTYSQADIENMIARAVAAGVIALEQVASTGYAGLYGEAPTSAPDHVIGSNAVPYSSVLVRNGRQLLLTALAPDEVHHVIDPIQWGHAMQDADTKQWMHNTRAGNLSWVATLGVQPDRYLGDVFGVHTWVANAMIASTGIHSIMFARGGIGKAFKNISTKMSPTPSRVNVETDWVSRQFGVEINVRTIHDITGFPKSSTTNNWVVDITTLET